MPIRLVGTLKIDDIAGESGLAEHEDEIDIHRVNWKIAQRNIAAVGSGRTQSRAEIHPIYLDRYVDAASPYLALTCMKGSSIPEAVLTLRKDSGDAHLDYLQVTMTNCIVASYELLNLYDTEETPLQMVPERIALSFESVKMLYVVQADDHSAGDEHEIEYDIVAGA